MKTPQEYTAPITASLFEKNMRQYTLRQSDIFRWVYELMIEKEWNYKQVGEFVKKDGGNISKIFNGKYEGNLDAFATIFETAKDEYITKNGAATPDFVETALTGNIFFVCEKVMNAREAGLIFGRYGIGKTKGGKEFCNRNPKTSAYYACEPALSFGAFVQSFAISIGIKEKQSIPALRRTIKSKLSRTQKKFLFIDEVTVLFTTCSDKVAIKCIEFIRWLKDELDIGVVLCGTDVLPTQLEDSKFSKALGQITDRGNTQLNLKSNYKVSELTGFYKFFGLPEKPNAEAYALIKDILRTRSLRQLIYCLRDGASAASNMGHSNSWDHFLDAYTINQSLNPDNL